MTGRLNKKSIIPLVKFDEYESIPCSLTNIKPITQKILAVPQLRYAVRSGPINEIDALKINCIRILIQNLANTFIIDFNKHLNKLSIIL